MLKSAVRLRKIETVAFPGNPDVVYLSQKVATGVKPFKEVAPKLSAALQGLTEASVSKGTIDFYQALDSCPALAAADLEEYGYPVLNWWPLLWILQSPTDILRSSLPTGSNIAGLMRFPRDPLPLRVKIDWENGHFAGQQSTEERWEWSPGTIFPVISRS